MLSGSPVPLLIVRRGQVRPLADDEDYRRLRFQRILVPATGTPAGRAAEELAYTIAERLDAEVDAVHVVSRRDRAVGDEPSAEGELTRALSLAQRFGRGASPVLRVGSVASEEIIECADDRGVDLLVIGAQLRRHQDGHPFLGHGAEFVLEHANQTVAVVVLPGSSGAGA